MNWNARLLTWQCLVLASINISTFDHDQIAGSTRQSRAIKNMNDRDHIMPIGRRLYKLGLQPMPCYAAVQCLSMSTADCRWCPDTAYARRRDGVGLGVGSWSNSSSSSSMLVGRSGETRWVWCGHGCTGCGSCDSCGPWRRVDWCSGGAKHSTSGSNYCCSNTVTHQTRQLYTRPRNIEVLD